MKRIAKENSVGELYIGTSENKVPFPFLIGIIDGNKEPVYVAFDKEAAKEMIKTLTDMI
jgi:hypothetical protein